MSVSRAHCDVDFCSDRVNESNTTTEDASLVDVSGRPNRPFIIPSVSSNLSQSKVFSSAAVTQPSPPVNDTNSSNERNDGENESIFDIRLKI
ncbi:hypothetical protein TNCV_4382631 [Trichonephila clavipes]|nr:hypothetical protein TNCV_4382631 [Trichonephila clavipes]